MKNSSVENPSKLIGDFFSGCYVSGTQLRKLRVTCVLHDRSKKLQRILNFWLGSAGSSR